MIASRQRQVLGEPYEYSSEQVEVLGSCGMFFHRTHGRWAQGRWSTGMSSYIRLSHARLSHWARGRSSCKGLSQRALAKPMLGLVVVGGKAMHRHGDPEAILILRSTPLMNRPHASRQRLRGGKTNSTVKRLLRVVYAGRLKWRHRGSGTFRACVLILWHWTCYFTVRPLSASGRRAVCKGNFRITS